MRARWLRKAAVGIALLGVSGGVAGGLAGAAQAPPVTPSMDLAPNTGPTGTVVTISGVVDPNTCGQANQITNYIITRTQFIDVTLPITVGTGGTFATSVTIPAVFVDGFNGIDDAPLVPGTVITFEVNCPSGPVTADFTVTAPATTTTTTAPAFVPPPAPPADAGDFTGPLPGSKQPGEEFTIDERGFEPDEEVHVVLYSDPKILTTVNADSTGRVLVAVAVPADTEPGAHTVVLFSESKVVKAPLTVEALSAQAPTQSTLPRTGSTGTAGSAGAGVLLVAAGVCVVLASRRRLAAS